MDVPNYPHTRVSESLEKIFSLWYQKGCLFLTLFNMNPLEQAQELWTGQILPPN